MATILGPERVLLLSLLHQPEGNEHAWFGVPGFGPAGIDGQFLWPREDWERHGRPTQVTVMMVPGDRLEEVHLPGSEADVARRRVQRAQALDAATRVTPDADADFVLSAAEEFEAWVETGRRG